MPEITRLSQRHDPDTMADLKAVSKASGISQVNLIAHCIEGLKKTWEEEGELIFPLRVVPESWAKQRRHEKADSPSSGESAPNL